MTGTEIGLRGRLKDAMEVDGLTQSDVATHLDISQSYVSKFLRGGDVSKTIEMKIRAFLGDVDSHSVITRDELRKAVRLYKWIKDAQERDASLVIREADGTEKLVVFLW